MPYESMQQPVAPDTPHRIYLQPIAAPSILGLYALAGGVFVVSTNMAHWYGSSETMLLLIPFVVFLVAWPNSWPECGPIKREMGWRRCSTACGDRSLWAIA